MDRKALFPVVVAALILGLLVVGGVALAQTSASYNLEWHVIGGGGRPVASANYAVNSTARQGLASPPYSVGANYAVSGGYWSGHSVAVSVYLPVMVKGYP
jgi:hypothetical protein